MSDKIWAGSSNQSSQILFSGSCKSIVMLFSDTRYRNATKLPESYAHVLKKWVLDLDSDDLDKNINAQRELFILSELMEDRKFLNHYSYSYVDPPVHDLRKRLENPLDMALAKICWQIKDREEGDTEPRNSYRRRMKAADAYITLASNIDRYSRVLMLFHVLD